MLERSAWSDCIPHQGRMALIERVVAFDTATIQAESDNHRAPDHPLRHAQRLHALHLCEYGAQAMAVHGALSAKASGQAARPGLLVALRSVRLHVERIDDIEALLSIRAQRVHADDAAWLYAFQVTAAEQPLADGQAMVMLDSAS